MLTPATTASSVSAPFLSISIAFAVAAIPLALEMTIFFGPDPWATPVCAAPAKAAPLNINSRLLIIVVTITRRSVVQNLQLRRTLLCEVILQLARRRPARHFDQLRLGGLPDPLQASEMPQQLFHGLRTHTRRFVQLGR